jgi:hypothetical protein
MSLLRPVILYGSEIWTRRKTDELRLVIIRGKFLGKYIAQFLIVQQNNGKNYICINYKLIFKIVV